VDVPLVLVVAVGLAAAYLPPRPFWWAQLVATGLPYAAWVLAFFGAVALASRWWGLAALHVVLVGAVVLRAAPVARLATPLPGGAELAVVTFNVPQVGPSREALGDSVARFVGGARPDLVALQDAWVYAPRQSREQAQAVQVEAVRERLPYTLELPARLAGHPGWRENGTGVPVLVRSGAGVEVLEQEALVIGAESDPDVSLALRTHLRWDGREAVLYNVHLRSFGEEKPWDDADVRWTRPATWAPYLRRYRAAYARRGDEVEEIARRVETEALPVVVAGDLNSTADNWTYRRLRSAGLDAGPLDWGRLDAFRQAGGLAWGRTYPADRPIVRIDFVLADPALEVVAAETTPVGFSDHRPVGVRLRWRTGAAVERAEEPAAGGPASGPPPRTSRP
jgi:endonuclease/exonuclease/phosphatase family metal-dependent hydrolase